MSHLQVEQHGAVRLLTMDDGKANALSARLIADIDAALGDAESDPATRAVVLTGREGRFSAGFDLGVMGGDDIGAMVELVADGGALVRRIYGADVPVVAACTGHALAAGALLLLGCDIRLGADTEAKIGLNEVAIGMVLPAWAMTIASARLSRRWLERSVMNAKIFDPSTAADAGFLDEVVPSDQIVTRAIAAAEELAGLDANAYRGSVGAFRAKTLTTMAEQIAADRARV